MVSRETVRWAFLMILGREPESEEVYDHHCGCADVEQLRSLLISSEEGSQRLRHDLQHTIKQLPFDFFRHQYVFIHIEKTGGTSIYESMAPCFAGRRISLPHVSDLRSYTLAELNQYDFISGHMTFGEAMALPRSRKLLMATFRDPLARLISFYRYHRAHPSSARNHSMVALAQDLSPQAFFSHDEVRSDARVNNRYLGILCDVPGDADHASMAQYMPSALDRLRSIDVIGITEQLSATAALFASRAEISLAGETSCVNATDDLPREGSGFKPVEKVPVTQELERIVAPLIRCDAMIYQEALRLFSESSRT